jgi:hypothetical protein
VTGRGWGGPVLRTGRPAGRSPYADGVGGEADLRAYGGLVVLVPLLHRAHRFPVMAASLAATCPEAALLYCATPGDAAVLAALDEVRARYILVPHSPVGDYARKINAGVVATTEALLFFGADDIVFQPGWWQAATAQLGPNIGVVGTNDCRSPRVITGAHSTHFLVTRSYVATHGTIDEAGKALHEGYPHEYVDDELIGTARYRQAYGHAGDAHVIHEHPNWSHGVAMDELYLAQPARMRAGRPLFLRRRHLWAGA